ncbi:site-2 protease family protein [Paenibacillus sp.]|uniref:site-2 protease family protein n=1 Tax=Paenibacillus sp. TaxID=58172 RepID=UPI002D6A0F9A|nr:site-2 protease family protein [Paenibacillus sp.]HZG84711.1 site-2 protease family protein [Paenibacillus sp.]
MEFLPFNFEHLPFQILAIIVAFTAHEFAHAYSAYKFGDPTAYKLGRVTLNPMPHISLLGFVFILLLGFGWARPVPVNRSNFKNPRLMSIVVSAVGPLSNLLVAFVTAAAAYALFATGALNDASLGAYKAVGLIFFYLVQINLLLFIFNLIPLPPLDGYRIVEDLAPRPLRLQMMKYEAWGVYIFLLIVFITPIYNVTIGPILSQVVRMLFWLLGLMASWFGNVVDWQTILA